MIKQLFNNPLALKIGILLCGYIAVVFWDKVTRYKNRIDEYIELTKEQDLYIETLEKKLGINHSSTVKDAEYIDIY
jgi:hypothetical protein